MQLFRKTPQSSLQDITFVEKPKHYVLHQVKVHQAFNETAVKRKRENKKYM